MEHNNDRRITVDSQLSGLNKLAIDREMFTSSVDAGFVLALPFQHGDLEPDCVGVLIRGAYVRDKNTSAKLCTKNAGGGLCARRGGVFAGHYSMYVQDIGSVVQTMEMETTPLATNKHYEK